MFSSVHFSSLNRTFIGTTMDLCTVELLSGVCYKLPEIAECGKLFYQNLCCILYSPLKEYPSNATGIQQGM